MYLEYIWLDGNYPQNLRSKIKVIDDKNIILIKHRFDEIKYGLTHLLKHDLIPEWGYDGSSTLQANTAKSEMILKPCNIFVDPFKKDSLLVLCEVCNVNGSPHSSNKRSILRENLQYDQNTWYGFENEYFIYDVETDRPLGWPKIIEDSDTKFEIIFINISLDSR